MKSGPHALVSLGVAVAALAVTTPPIPAAGVVAVALVAGVGVDVDHFLIARYNAGDWRALRACLRDPRLVFVRQEEIFEEGREVDAIERLVSHLVVGGAAVGILWVASPYLAGLVAATLYAHVLADAISTARSAAVVDPDTLSESDLHGPNDDERDGGPNDDEGDLGAHDDEGDA